MNQARSQKPLVAVITRTKDRELLLDRAFQSIYAQTMPDFIHVLVNDGGDKKVIENVVARHKAVIKDRLKIIHSAENQGMEAASNKAIRSVDSTFIAIHDDDDTWHPDFLKKTTAYLEKTKAMGVVVTTDRVVEEITDGKIKTLKKDRWLPNVHEISLYKQCLDNYATPITFLYRRSVFRTIGYYDESLLVNGDWDFAIRFMLHYDIDFLDSEPALANYHHRPKNMGIDGNSVFAGRDLHNYFTNQLRNKYLRMDLRAGKFGVGYIMSELQYELEKSEEVKNIMNAQVDRLEKHVDYNTRLVKEHIDLQADNIATRIIDSLFITRISKKVKRQ
jgi:glycosyltransferase involved in cell wall biosynthesis